MATIGGQTAGPIMTKFGTSMWIDLGIVPTETKLLLGNPGGILGVSGGIQFENLGQLPNDWTDRDPIWHTCADSSWNGHRLKKTTPSRHHWAFCGNRR